jgi:hypothetical protein
MPGFGFCCAITVMCSILYITDELLVTCSICMTSLMLVSPMSAESSGPPRQHRILLLFPRAAALALLREKKWRDSVVEGFVKAILDEVPGYRETHNHSQEKCISVCPSRNLMGWKKYSTFQQQPT